MKKAIVIGSGIGGLASSIRLAIKGYEVTVYEANSYPGGKLTELELNEFRFDAGPSLFTMPELVDELFTLANKKNTFKYKRLDTVCNYFYEDGTRLTAFADPEKFAEESAQKTGVKKEDVINHLKRSAFIYKTTGFLFLERSLHKFKSYLSFQVLLSALKIPFLHIYTTMHKLNKTRLKNEKMTQLFNRYATYNGSNPYKAPGILHIIPHLEFNKGAYFPIGGMYQITTSIFELAKELGVTFNFESKVEKILVENKRAVGIEVNKHQELAEIIVCNMDVVPAYRNLMPSQKQPEKILKQERSSSALIFYWGINHTFPELDLHNIFFSDNYKKEFSHLFDEKDVYEDPTVYVNITSKANKHDAPDGKENWFTMINVPYDEGQDWETIKTKARKDILNKLSRILNKDIETLIECEEILEPKTIASKTQSYKGALYGTSSNEQMAAFFRHPNFSKNIQNLYFCGGSVHPGGGIPLALSSAKIIDSFLKPVHS